MWFREGKYFRAHRYIMEKHLGRKLSYDEVVHRRDHNKLNNHISNLEVMDRAEHTREHLAGKYTNPNNTATHKQCCVCGEIKPRSAYTKCSKHADGLRYGCTPCRKEQRRVR